MKHNVICKSVCVVYRIECSLCEKSQYVGKSEDSLNLRMSTHRNDVWRIDSPLHDKHFQMPGHNFNVHATFAVIEDFYNTSLSKLKIHSLLEHRIIFLDFEIENFFPARSKHITYLSSRQYWVHLVAMLRLISTHLLVHFILYRTLSHG